MSIYSNYATMDFYDHDETLNKFKKISVVFAALDEVLVLENSIHISVRFVETKHS